MMRILGSARGRIGPGLRGLALAAGLAALVPAGAGHAQIQVQPRRGEPFPYFIAPSGQPFRAGPNRAPPVEQWFAQADADHDGAVTRDEFVADSQHFFEFLDVDHDGMINGPENTRYETRVAPEITVGGPDPFPVQQRSVDGTPVRSRTRPLDGAARFSFFNEPQPVRVADTNLDWQVSVGEWLAASQRRFATLDVNHDGRLTLAELPPAPDPRRANR